MGLASLNPNLHTSISSHDNTTNVITISIVTEHFTGFTVLVVFHNYFLVRDSVTIFQRETHTVTDVPATTITTDYLWFFNTGTTGFVRAIICSIKITPAYLVAVVHSAAMSNIDYFHCRIVVYCVVSTVVVGVTVLNEVFANGMGFYVAGANVFTI